MNKLESTIPFDGFYNSFISADIEHQMGQQIDWDCDFTLFYNAYKAKYNKELKFQVREDYETHPIRNLPSYTSWQFNLYWNPLKGKKLKDYLNS